MTDYWQNKPVHLSDPASRSVPVVPDDAAELADLPRAIFVGSAGQITGRLDRDTQDRVFKNLAPGEHPLRFKLIKATGTTAADILALY